MDELAKAGAMTGRSAAVVAEWGDVTITMLTDSAAVEAVMVSSYAACSPARGLIRSLST